MDIKRLQPDDSDVLRKVAPDVFDHPLDPLATLACLRDPRHHLFVAIDGDVVVGFASAVHYVHPDKPSPELWINEVGVAPTHQGRGVGAAILRTLLDHARELGCAEAWVLTEPDNQAALRLYASNGGARSATDAVMFTFPLTRDVRS